MSTGPKRWVTSSSIRRTWSGSFTSRSTAIASPPEALISVATASDRSRVRAAKATFAPTPARALAKASPSPVLPPVTTATLPVRSKASRTVISYLPSIDLPPPSGAQHRARSTRGGRGPPLVITTQHASPSAPEAEDVEQDGPDDAADDRTYDRDPGVPPVVVALAGYRQDGVGYARAQVSSRVYGVPSRTPE